MEIKDALKRFRQSLNLSQRQLAEKVGVPYQSYQTYEYGNSIPSAKVIVKLAIAFDVSADYLLGLSDEPRPKTLPVEDKTFFELVAAGTAILQDALRKATSDSAIQAS